MNEQQEHLSGTVERVTFHNPDNGFCVLRLDVKGQRDLVTVIGTSPSIVAGELIDCLGCFVFDRQHGRQFRATHLTVLTPDTLIGLEKYLGSGLIKGIGPAYAKKLVKTFGFDIFTVIEQTPERLLEVPRLGKKRQDRIVMSWAEQKHIRAIMVFLQGHGLGTARAVRIFKTYGLEAIEKIKTNPYRLADDIRGIGFKSADALAQKLGLPQDSPVRAAAGLKYILHQQSQQGHCGALISFLVTATSQLLDIAADYIQTALTAAIASGDLVAVLFPEPGVMLSYLYHAESQVAQRLQKLQVQARPWPAIDIPKALTWVEDITGLHLSNSQRDAVTTALQHKVTIITGGPGVGKTTVLNSILKILKKKVSKMALCAPTGRAAKRLQETTQITAHTIHRLLQVDRVGGGFHYNADNPLPVDLVVVDETSMVDIKLFFHLLKALPETAALILVGDVDQLPSVGPGAVLANCLDAGTMATIRLTEVFRQAAVSKIILSAHAINKGHMPKFYDNDSDFYFIKADTPEEIQAKILTLVAERIPQKFRCDPVLDIQILTPMNRGSLGAHTLNTLLQEKLTPASTHVTRYGTSFQCHDKVIQMVNNYDKDVFNGDIGFIRAVHADDNEVLIEFEGRIIPYEFDELDEVALAYAITIHKAQGSEFPVVVMPLATQHYTLLAKNLVYTGITRGKRLVIIVGQLKALALAVKNATASARLTKLTDRILAAEQAASDLF